MQINTASVLEEAGKEALKLFSNAPVVAASETFRSQMGLQASQSMFATRSNTASAEIDTPSLSS